MHSSDIWNELGNTYFASGNLDKAIDAYSSAIDNGMESGWLYSNLAAVYIKKNMHIEAIPLYQKSLECFEDRKDIASTWGRLGNVYHHLNEYGKAIQSYQKADEILPTWMTGRSSNIANQDVHTQEHEVNYFRGKSPQINNLMVWNEEQSLTYPLVSESPNNGAQTQVTSFITELLGSTIDKTELSDENAHVWNELGLVLFKVGAYEDAIEAYRKAILIDSSLGYLYSNLAQVFVTQGKLSDAIELYEYSINLFPTKKEKAVSWNRLGDIFRQLGRNDLFVPAYLLSEALNQEYAENLNGYRQIHPGLINIGLNHYRDIKNIDDLVKSIQNLGIIQPLIVSPDLKEPGKFILISGRRRHAAALRLGLQVVPVIIRNVSALEMLEISISENIHTNTVDPFELAQGYRQLANDFGLSIEEISERTGRSCHSIANTLKIVHSTASDQNQSSNGSSSPEFIPAENSAILREFSGITGVDSIENQERGFYQQVNAVLSEVVVAETSSKRLWYLDNGADVSQKSDSSSLLSRARDVIKSNPHPGRVASVPSYHA